MSLVLDWLESGGEAVVAEVRSALAEERWSDLASLLDDYFFALSIAAPQAVRETWAAVPREWLMDHPRYLMAASISRSASGFSSMFAERAERIFTHWVEAQQQPATRDVLGVMTATMRRLLTAGRFDRAAATADQIEAVVREGTDHVGFDDVLGIVLLRLGVTRLLCGDVSRSIEAFSEGWRWSTAAQPHPIAPYLAGYAALSHALAGDIAHAASWRARGTGTPPAEPKTMAFQLQNAGLVADALIGIGRFDRDAAEEAIREIGHGIESGELWWAGAHARARIALYWGDRSRAAHEIERNLLEFPSLTGSGTLAGALLRADLADIRQAEGDMDAAEQLLEQVETPGCHPLVVSSRVRLMMSRGGPSRALALLNTAARRGRVPTSPPARWEVLRANLALVMNAVDGNRVLKVAAERIERTEAYDVLFDALPPVRDAIARHTAVPEMPDWEYPRPPQIALTPRERHILGLLRTHASVKELAAALYISPNTAKSHLRRLYRKLSVASRDQAVRAAANLLGDDAQSGAQDHPGVNPG